MAYQGNLRPHDEMRAAALNHTVLNLRQRIFAGLSGWRIPFSERGNLLFLVDTLLVLLAVGITHHNGHFWLPGVLSGNAIYQNWHWFFVMAGCWWVLAYLNDLYYTPSTVDYLATTLRIVSVGVLGALGFWGLDYLFPAMFPLSFSLFALALGLSTVLCWRLVYIRFLRTISTPQRILILGPGSRSQVIGEWLSQVSTQDYQVVGYVDDGLTHLDDRAATQMAVKTPSLEESDLLANLGPATDLWELCQQWAVNEVLVAVKDELSPDLFPLLATCQGQGVRVSWMADVYERLAYFIPVQYVNPTWALCAMQGKPIFRHVPMISKRLLDLLIVLFSLPILGLVIPLLALAIRWDSPGPIFYRQIRSGRGGKPFGILKFRTMVVDAERAGEARWATKNDPRITRVGQFLRKTRLDELPQLINILKGEMSIVGPRPERPEFVTNLQAVIPFYDVRLTVKPGLTGWAQIHYNYGNTVEDALVKLQYDFYYIRYWSLWLDLYTIFKTIFVVLRSQGL